MSGYYSGMYKEKKQFIHECMGMMSEIQQWAFVKQLKNPRAEHVFKERMGFYHTVPTLQELGDTLGVTRTRVHQIEQYSIDKAIGVLTHVHWIVHTDEFFSFVRQGLKKFTN